MINLRGFQLDLRTDIFEAWQQYRNVLAVLPTGGGKCLGKDTPVLMYDGSIKPVQDVTKGDLLMGPDSSPRTVLSTCAGQEMLYKITPTKGDSYIVNESHVLSLRQTGLRSNPKYKSEEGKNTIVNISVREYLTKSNYFKHTHKGWRTGVEFNHQEQSVPSYILGVWLGDGTSRSPEISSVDDEVIKEWMKYAENIDCSITIKDMTRCPIYSVISNKGGWGDNHLRNFLKNNLLFNNKHIPHFYKTGDRQQRLELLAGLIDTDGYLRNGYYDIVFKQEALAKDTIFVARSLGLAAYVKPCVKVCTNTGSKGDYWRISISGDTDMIPCRVSRRIAGPRKQKKNVLNVGIKVEPIGDGDYYGFEISGDHLFMLGDFTVTHNTVTFSDILAHCNGRAASIAHRKELIGQMSMTLAKFGLKHSVIAPKNVTKWLTSMHYDELGSDFIRTNSSVTIAGIDTLKSRIESLRDWGMQQSMWVQDEAHHMLLKNKWGQVTELFPNAYGLGVTTTPSRADGNGLGRHHDGLFDTMIEGPGMRELIDMGYLTDYRIFAPPSDLNLDNVDITKSGDFSKSQLSVEVKQSHITGDVVEHYKRIAMGKLGITFTDSVETATIIAAQFIQADVPAAVVSSKTPDKEREAILRKFRNREYLQLINVDLFGEGFDLPSVEVVSMARPTASYGLYVQQFGRALRLLLPDSYMAMWDQYPPYQRLQLIAASSKPVGIIIDHVGNVVRHGLPDASREWTLDRREKRVNKDKDPDDIPLTVCTNEGCYQPYERIYSSCPWCGHIPTPAARSAPEFVDGDLFELDAETLREMRGAVAKVDGPVYYPVSMDGPARTSLNRRHFERQQGQQTLRDSIAWWAGYHNARGRSDSESQRRFYHQFGVDVMTAMALGKADADKLTGKIHKTLDKWGLTLEA